MAARRSLRAIKFIGAVEDEWQLYSDNASDYSLGRPIGIGASSIVYQADYHPSSGESISCALKVLDLDSLPMSSLRLLRRETQLMSLSKHPNVLRVRGAWMDGHKLYIAMRLMRSGSVADVIHYGWPRGVEEEVTKCILRQALEGLNYLHINGFIHRDVKAANLLIDDDGTVLLGDLGVAAALDEEDSLPVESTITSSHSMPQRPPIALRSTARMGRRKSFVGTPCWMAPEVISQRNYDSKADIWSLGITALELAQGRAPRSREPPQQVLMKTIQDEPPTLDPETAQFKYSKSFKEFVRSCLSKDPSKRPTAEELLQAAFFKASKKKDYLVRTMLQGLPPLVDRQERRRIPSALGHLSMESWDFSQGGIVSPSPSIRTEGLLDDGIFEMEETREMIQTSEDNKAATSILPHMQLMDARTEAEDSPPGELTDEAPSTPAISLPSSYPTQRRHSPGFHSVRMDSTPMVEPSPSSPSMRGASPSSPSPSLLLRGTSPSSPSLSSSLKGSSPSSPSGIWRKLKGRGSKTPLAGEKRPDEVLTKRLR